MQILPLTLVPPVRPASPASGPHGGAGSSGAERAAAMICSLPLPDSRASMAEVGALARSLGSALGYLALLLDLLSRFLQLPVAHRCAFQGSTSRMWQPDSFFDMRATPPNDALTLSWPKAADEWVGGGAGQQQQQQQRQEQQLRTALHTLQRSAGMLVYARLGPEAALKVPPDWPPFTWLAGLCKMLAAEPRPSSGRMAVPGPRNLAASAVFGRYSPEHGGMAQSVLFQGGWVADKGFLSLRPPDGLSNLSCSRPSADGGGTDEGEEEWEHLPQPAYGMIPPPPSQVRPLKLRLLPACLCCWQRPTNMLPACTWPCCCRLQPEDVEHWVQAMYADNGGGSNSTGNGAAAAAASYGTSPMARLRALTRAYLGTALLLPG
jgi:hypothetical protein